MKKIFVTYYPGILLFVVALLVGLYVYQDYGMSWDEPEQRAPGIMAYDYMVSGKEDLFNVGTDSHGAGFEILLVFFERKMNITNTRDIYLMRHLVTHIFFLISVFFGYVLVYRLFKNKLLASLGFIMLLCAPRIYAHSFFNSKDVPFLSMVIISLALYQLAFEKNKPVFYLVLGLACGYMTSIRIMGVMLCCFVVLSMISDMISGYAKKERQGRAVVNLLLFTLGACSLLFAAWPYLWRDPLHHFTDSFSKFSHFDWGGVVLFNGKMEQGVLPWSYFPTWFLISNPELWLMAGFAGMVWIMVAFFKQPLSFLRNTTERNFLIYLLCFCGPIFAVLFLHSIIYDDWRHLYFVYPPFVLMALYFLNKVINGKYRVAALAGCLLQVGSVLYFMVKDHPFQQVYFNRFVSHDKEYLRRHYDLEYWGGGFYQGLKHLLATRQGEIKINTDLAGSVPYRNNVRMLTEDEKSRINFVDEAHADYFITNYRMHPDDFPYPKVEYSISVFNSTILCIYKMH